MTPTPSTRHPSLQSREELLTFMPIVHAEVARMLRRVPPNVLRDDLVAAGSAGLLDALRRSTERGAGFPWYARVRIRGALVDELRSQDWLSRRARARVTTDESPGGTLVVGLDDLPPSEQQLTDDTSSTPLELVERRTQRAGLERAVALLPEREADIVTWHYFDEVAFNTIAARLGVSEPRVSQLHSRALYRLKARLTKAQDGELAA
jgi:RNA polymerase sigma factor for flagellar operon FliA